jgi:hypothetical protein
MLQKAYPLCILSSQSTAIILFLPHSQDNWFLPNATTYAVGDSRDSLNFDRRFLATFLDLLSLRENLEPQLDKHPTDNALITLITVMDSLTVEACQHVRN